MNDLTRCILGVEVVAARRRGRFFADIVDEDSGTSLTTANSGEKSTSLLAISSFVDSGVAIWLNTSDNPRPLFDEPFFSGGDGVLGSDIGEVLMRRKEDRMDGCRPWDLGE